jgi:hypothetical protein
MVELEKAGVPTALLCTTPFMAIAKAMGSGSGRSRLRVVEIAHPLGAISSEEVERRAESAVDRVEQVWRGEGLT